MNPERLLQNSDRQLIALCDEMEARLTANTTISRQLLKATLQEALSGANYGVKAVL